MGMNSQAKKINRRQKVPTPVAEDVTLANPQIQAALEAIKDPKIATKGWGILYGVAAAYLREGKVPPEPIATLMANRLNAISQKLLSNP
jgi:hypothetical protein